MNEFSRLVAKLKYSMKYISDNKPVTIAHMIRITEAATGGNLQKKLLLKISLNSQENICARVSFLIKL